MIVQRFFAESNTHSGTALIIESTNFSSAYNVALELFNEGAAFTLWNEAQWRSMYLSEEFV